MHFLFRKGKVFHNGVQTIVGGQHHSPVVDEAFADGTVIHLALNLVQSSLPSIEPPCVEIVTVTHQTDGYVGRTHIAKLHELLVFVRFFLCSLTPLRLQEDDP